MHAQNTLAALLLLHTGVTAQTPGMLDPNFNTNGYTITDLSGANVYDGAVGLATSTSLGVTTYFVLGTAEVPASTGTKFTLALYGADGNLQSSAFHQIDPTDITQARACARVNSIVPGQSNYFITGLIELPNGTKVWHLAKLGASLTLLTSFSDNGWTETNLGGPNTDVAAMAVQPDGKVILAGYIDDNIALLRHTADGPLDVAFSTDGRVVSNVPGGIEDKASALAVAQDGSIFVAGTVLLDNGQNQRRGFVGKYLQNGDLDLGWGTNGFIMLHWGGSGVNDPWGTAITGSSFINSMAIGPDNKLVVVGRSVSGGTEPDQDFCIARLNADGTLDPGFSTDGKQRVGFAPAGNGANVDGATSVVVDGEGGVIVAGEVQGSTASKVGIARFNPNGAPDTDFGTSGNGMLITDFGGLGHTVGQVLLDAQGRIVVTGSWRSLQSTTTNSFIARYIGVVVGVLELSAVEGIISVYPNPVAGPTTFEYTLAEVERLTITLTDLQGRVITTFLDGQMMPAGAHQQTVTMPPQLAHGNYLLVFSSPNGRMSVQISK
ncbi:MAG: T9SS type A sorting domain-containing protein [Flavobacteriales bacterium]